MNVDGSSWKAHGLGATVRAASDSDVRLGHRTAWLRLRPYIMPPIVSWNKILPAPALQLRFIELTH
jgi:hypothetical protein